MSVNLKPLFICVCLIVACGEKASPPLQISLSPTSDLQDVNALDLVIIASSQPTNGFILDLNGDNMPDQFVFPSGCSPSASGCGFPLASPATVQVGYLPLDFNYTVEARVRNAAGTTLYHGSGSLLNDGSATTLPITLVVGP